ncbi:uncharacterized protein LOC111086560 isoform X3 [Limulus polyphemus]|uniref:Uncharacterized protein LOC111086560 isoform X3 n=1 Tax=Limulus polyphemus TaxID=6850 RepID=A0ABM1SPJ7_LIMPO|nr:uncharacterized protein LOC111086560 isoform X3 [Limulus polyphemus]
MLPSKRSIFVVIFLFHNALFPEAERCDYPDRLVHLEVKNTHDSEETVTFVCSKGYILIGNNNTRRCLPDSTLSGRIPVCDLIQQFTVYVIGMKNNYQTCSSFNGLFASRRRILVCEGDRGISGRYIHIKDNRPKYRYFGICEVEVYVMKDVTCPTLTLLQNGKVKMTDFPRQRPGQGSRAIYSCVDGYMLHGNATRVCQEDGSWSGRSPVCFVSVDAVRGTSSYYGQPSVAIITGTVLVSSLTLLLLLCFLVIKRRRGDLEKCAVYPESLASISSRIDTKSSAGCLWFKDKIFCAEHSLKNNSPTVSNLGNSNASQSRVNTELLDENDLVELSYNPVEPSSSCNKCSLSNIYKIPFNKSDLKSIEERKNLSSLTRHSSDTKLPVNEFILSSDNLVVPSLQDKTPKSLLTKDPSSSRGLKSAKNHVCCSKCEASSGSETASFKDCQVLCLKPQELSNIPAEEGCNIRRYSNNEDMLVDPCILINNSIYAGVFTPRDSIVMMENDLYSPV